MKVFHIVSRYSVYNTVDLVLYDTYNSDASCGFKYQGRVPSNKQTEAIIE